MSAGISRFLGVVLGLTLVGRIAAADLPPPSNTIVVGGIQLGASSGGVVDPRVELRVDVRDQANQPMANSVVSFEFAGCAGSDLHLSDVQTFPGMMIDCAKRTVSAVSDALGVARFRILGSASATSGSSPGLTTACVMVRADGLLVNSGQPVFVGAYDLNGNGGVDAADLSLCLSTVLLSPAGYRSRADFNGSGTCNAADLSKCLDVVLNGQSLSSVSSTCF